MGKLAPQPIDEAEDFSEQLPRHCNLGQLESDIETMADDLGTDLDQLLPQRGQRPVLYLLRQSQCPNEVAQIVGQGVKPSRTSLLRNFRHDSRVHLIAFLPSLMCYSAVPR